MIAPLSLLSINSFASKLLYFLLYCVPLNKVQIQILAFLYFRSYNIIFYHNNCYFPAKSTQAFLPECHKSHFYTLTSNPFLNMNLITTTNCIISQISKVNLAPNHFEFHVCNFANLNLIIAVSSLIL